eukprot:1712305-Alexandrium_andersonii.AAC.1
MSASLVGSEMCIRDRDPSSLELRGASRSSAELRGALRSFPIPEQMQNCLGHSKLAQKRPQSLPPKVTTFCAALRADAE